MSQKKPTTLSDFSDLKEIGKGAFGTVYRAKYNKNGRMYALKKISKKQIQRQQMISQLNNQIKISRSIKHDNVIRLLDTFQQDDYIYLVLELAHNGQMYAKLKKQGRFTERQTKKMLKDVLEAIKFLHKNNPPIIHRDIKPENLLLDKNNRVKLADFGWSNFSNKPQPRKTYCGTFDYLAPEMIDKSGHDERLDIWCLGVLTYQLLTGHTPFVNNSRNKKEIEQNIINVRINFPQDFPTLAKDFIMGMIKRNPSERMTLEEIQNHPWLKQSDQQPIQIVLQKVNPSSFIKQDKKIDDSSELQMIIESQKRTIQSLQKQLENQKKITQAVQKQLYTCKNGQNPNTFITNAESNGAMMEEIRKLKAKLNLYEKEDENKEEAWNKISAKEKEIIVLKSKIQQLEDNLMKTKNQKDYLSRKYDKAQSDLQSSRRNQKLLQQKVQKLNGSVGVKFKEGRKIKSQEITSDGFISYVQQQLQLITEKFEENKKILNQVKESQRVNEEREDELARLRAQQKNIKDQIKAQMKEQYQNQIDNLIIKYKKQLDQEKQKWFLQYEELRKNYEGNSQNLNNDTQNSAEKERDMLYQLQMQRQLNASYKKTIDTQQSKIRDLEDALKRKN